MCEKVSIITVVYNAKLFIERTIQSVVNQDYNSIEYIVVDGNSDDGTKEIIEKYKDKISIYISEKDNGLYYAMNKALELANGEYVWFLNAGDIFCSTDTVKNIFDRNDNADIYYGETMIVDDNNNDIGTRRLHIPQNLNWKSFKKGMCVSHQAIVIKKSLTKLYDTKYKYSSDFEWIIYAMQKAKTIVNLDKFLIRYLDGGLTKFHIKEGLKERFKIMTNYYGLLATLFNHIPIAFRFIFYVIKNRRF